jgi:hypothetical protein
MVADIESESLPTHVSLCQERYKRLEDRLESVEHKLDEMSKTIEKMRLGFFKIMVSTSGSIIVAIIGAVAAIKHF